MNIFENYLSKINKVVRDNKDSLDLVNLDNLKNVNLEVPPDHFNFDLSTNIRYNKNASSSFNLI